MKLKFNNRKIADNCTFIAYSLIMVICFLGILSIADLIFGWDVLSGSMEQLAYLIMGASAVVIASTFLISLMVNMNIMSQSLEDISERMLKNKDDE